TAAPTAPSGAGPSRSGSTSLTKTSSPRRRSTNANSRPMKPCPTTRTRPRGSRSAPRRTHARGSANVADASSTDAGTSTVSTATARSANPPGTIVAAAKRSHVDSWPERQREHSPQGRWWTSATRTPSPVSATTSCPSTVPAGADPSFSTSEPHRPHARIRTRSPVPAGSGTSSSAAPPLPARTTARTAISYGRSERGGDGDGDQTAPLQQHLGEGGRPSVLARPEGSRRDGDRVRDRQGGVAPVETPAGDRRDRPEEVPLDRVRRRPRVPRRVEGDGGAHPLREAPRGRRS